MQKSKSKESNCISTDVDIEHAISKADHNHGADKTKVKILKSMSEIIKIVKKSYCNIFK